jgi:hypothetical protein
MKDELWLRSVRKLRNMKTTSCPGRVQHSRRVVIFDNREGEVRRDAGMLQRSSGGCGMFDTLRVDAGSGLGLFAAAG